MKRLPMRTAAAACAIALGVMLSGCSGSAHASGHSSASATRPVLRVTGAYVPQPPMGDMAAGYFTITNSGGTADELTGVSSDVAGTVSMHRTTAADQMVPVKAFTIPAHGTLVLSTGGNHLMLMKLRRKPMAGQTVTFRLRFATSRPMTVRAPVKPATYRPKG